MRLTTHCSPVSSEFLLFLSFSSLNFATIYGRDGKGSGGTDRSVGGRETDTLELSGRDGKESGGTDRSDGGREMDTLELSRRDGKESGGTDRSVGGLETDTLELSGRRSKGDVADNNMPRGKKGAETRLSRKIRDLGFRVRRSEEGREVKSITSGGNSQQPFASDHQRTSIDFAAETIPRPSNPDKSIAGESQKMAFTTPSSGRSPTPPTEAGKGVGNSQENNKNVRRRKKIR